MAGVERGWIVAPRDEDQRGPGFSWLEFPLELDDENEWPPVEREALWAERLAENGLYRIDTAPYFVSDIAIDTVVRAGPGVDEKLEFSEWVDGSDRSTVRIIFTDLSGGDRDDLTARISDLGCGVRFSPWDSLIALDVPTLDELFQLHQLLGPYRERDDLGYEDACVPSEYWVAHPELA